MAQTHDGAMKSLAKRAGVGILELVRLQTAGNKWCMRCREFRSKTNFHKDITRYDGLASACRRCRNKSESKSLSLSIAWKNKYQAGYLNPMRGRKFSEEARKNMGRLPGFVSELRGRERSIEVKLKISAKLRISARRGAANPSFKDGKVTERRGVRFSQEYHRWRFDVFVRDKFICQKCGYGNGGILTAHHMKSFADYPELRFDVDNGLTICLSCHIEIHRKEAPAHGRDI